MAVTVIRPCLVLCPLQYLPAWRQEDQKEQNSLNKISSVDQFHGFCLSSSFLLLSEPSSTPHGPPSLSPSNATGKILSVFSCQSQVNMLISAQEERRGGLCLQLPLGRPPPSPLPALPSPSLPRPLPHPPAFALPPTSHSVGSHPIHGGGSLGTPGRTMRDYDETFKEMKKENFNLKLRIFFLEVSQRVGQGQKVLELRG